MLIAVKALLVIIDFYNIKIGKHLNIIPMFKKKKRFFLK